MAAAAGDVIQEEDEDPDHPESNVSGGWPSSSSLHSSHGDVPQNPQNQEEPEAMAEAASVAGSSGSPSHHPHPTKSFNLTMPPDSRKTTKSKTIMSSCSNP